MWNSNNFSKRQAVERKENKIYTEEINLLIGKLIKKSTSSIRIPKILNLPYKTKYTLDKHSENEYNEGTSKIKKDCDNKLLKLKTWNVLKNYKENVNVNRKQYSFKIFSKSFRQIDTRDINGSPKINFATLTPAEISYQVQKFLKTNKNKTSFLEKEVDLIFDLIHSTLFQSRSYTIRDNKLLNIAEIDKATLIVSVLNEENSLIKVKDTNWETLLNTYEILIIVLNDYFPIIKAKISQTFINRLIDNIHNYDKEERLIVKYIIYKLYSSSYLYRKMIIDKIGYEIIDANYSSEDMSKLVGMTELLDLMKCIILGASLPMNEKIYSLIVNIICPLIKSSSLKYFDNNLKQMLIKISQIDKHSEACILSCLIRTWPVRYPDKVLIYLDILEAVILKKEKIEGEAVLRDSSCDTILGKVLKKLKSSINDANFLIADRSLIFFKDETFYDIIRAYSLENKYFNALIDNTINHWNSDIQTISKFIISKWINKLPQLYEGLNIETKRIVNNINSVPFDEEIWTINYNLKAD